MLRKLLICFVMLVVADPAAADDVALCNREAPRDVDVAACTRVINSGAGRPSVNYNSRGGAYREKGDRDRAIADFTEAIRLDPKDWYPYHNRGLAYHDKGEPDRAIADYTD